MAVDDITPRATWDALRADPDAALIDVRTNAEWNFVGFPDLSEAGKEPLMISWQVFPSMQVNAAFVDHLRKAGLTPLNKLYFLCRSGARSLAAAQAAQAAGFAHSFNISDGFEGPPDAEGHRGQVAGWKAEGLAWRQR
ncbi:sulfurtransferase [Pseudoroseomonas deserti]|uniref:Sulfurtransferase n=1 Tax=Teichococcus deserti TaxID=1817963 RepID=A0A1V2H9K1_9PROT|nr:rhodanese-like domain-containing protein [Pseudoroseomonas deserti]ONG59052.1 sulfurtransferase [Pseudoroseomonas deserti]